MSSGTSADPLVLWMAANSTLSGPAALNRIQQESDPVRVDLFASYRTKVLGGDAGFRLNWHNVANTDYRDRRGYFVQPSTLEFSAETRF